MNWPSDHIGSLGRQGLTVRLSHPIAASEAPLRVLYLQPAALFGGAERQAATTIPLLEEQNMEVVALAGPGPIIGEWFAERGISHFIHSRSFPGSWPKQRGLRRLTLPARYYQCLRNTAEEVEEIVRSHQIDVIFAALPFSWVAATPVARRLGIPIVWRAGGTELTSFEKTVLSGWICRWKPDMLVCNGAAVASTYGPLVRAPTAIIPNGVDTAQFSSLEPGDPSPRPRGGRITVGYAARLVEQKRPGDFIQLAARLARERPGVSFLIGGEGSRRPQYERMARRMGASNLRFLGYVDDMRAFYDACDLFVLPSRSEGCPNVVLEAMACGAAVVVSDASGTLEVVRDGVEGLVYPIGDVDALCRAVLRLVDDDMTRLAFTQRAKIRATGAFSAPACARKTACLLEAVAGRSRVRSPAASIETAAAHAG